MFCGEAEYLRIWDVAYKEGKYAKAITEFEKFIEKCPEGEWTTYARLHMGNCFLELGDEEQARECFDEVVQLNWNKCSTNRALHCLRHLDSGHEEPYGLSLDGKCPMCRE